MKKPHPVVQNGAAFRIRFPIRWEETDMAGVVFYGNYFRFFEYAEDELFRSHGCTRQQLIERFDVWLPRVEAHAEFQHPARFGDIVEMAVRIGRIGRSSVRYDFTIDRVDPGPAKTLVRGYTVVACVSRATFRAVPMPEEMRRVLERKPERAQG